MSHPTVTDVSLVLLWGQSNMSGYGADFSPFTDPAHPRILQYGSKSAALTPATEPLDMHDTPPGIGPGLQFARHWIADLADDHVIVLVPAAHGGTPLVSDDELAWRYGVDGNLSAQALDQARAAERAAADAFPAASVTYAAALWFQGESDSQEAMAISGAVYGAELRALIAGARSTLDAPLLPWIGMAFVPEAMTGGTREEILAVQSHLPYDVPATGFVEAPPAGYNGDAVHATAEAHRRFYAPRAYEEFRRIRGGRAATNIDFSVTAAPA